MTIELYAINKKINAFFARYHLVTFAFVASLLLAAAVYSLFTIIESTTATPTNTTSTITGFDQKTIDKIKSLRDSKNGTAQLELPLTRQSPFSE